MPNRKPTRTPAQIAQRRSNALRSASSSAGTGAAPAAAQVRDVLAKLERLGSQRIRDQMAPRYGIRAEKAFGVSVAALKQLARRLGPSHSLATALWKTGWYEARMLAVFIDEPQCVTPAQMDRWCRDFDNWAICDTACFHLFDRVPHAFRKAAHRTRRGRRTQLRQERRELGAAVDPPAPARAAHRRPLAGRAALAQ